MAWELHQQTSKVLNIIFAVLIAISASFLANMQNVIWFWLILFSVGAQIFVSFIPSKEEKLYQTHTDYIQKKTELDLKHQLNCKRVQHTKELKRIQNDAENMQSKDLISSAEIIRGKK